MGTVQSRLYIIQQVLSRFFMLKYAAWNILRAAVLCYDQHPTPYLPRWQWALGPIGPHWLHGVGMCEGPMGSMHALV